MVVDGKAGLKNEGTGVGVGVGGGGGGGGSSGRSGLGKKQQFMYKFESPLRELNDIKKKEWRLGF
jgi:hypothetical protein